MTADDLDRLERLAGVATPGPWFVRRLDDEHCMGAVAVSTRPDTGMVEDMRSGSWPSSEVVAACLIQQPPYVLPADDRFDENAALIAMMRTALPQLLRLARIGLAADGAGQGA
ncbi:MAG: hypothetical protein ACO1O3_18545 [Sphingobium sp.]